MSSTTLAAVVAKLAGLGLPAKAAGVAVAIGVIGGVPVVAHDVATSHDDSNVVNEAPETTDGSTAHATGEATHAAKAHPTRKPSAAASDEPSGSPTLPAAAAFGQSVAQDARDGGVDGQQIAQEARTKSASDTGIEHRPDATAPAQPTQAARPTLPTQAAEPTLPAPAATHAGGRG